MTFPMTPQQFSSLGNTLANNPGVQLRPANQLSGTISTSDVTLAYSYDKTAALTVDITAKHSWKAKLASTEQIEQRISNLLQGAR